MSTNTKWKSKLLSSSLPLEFEVAKILASKGFFVEADYAYSRDDSGVVKDFSVDIDASAWPPFSNPNEVKASLNVLVECKHRNPNVRWLFFPDPNKWDYTPFRLGQTLRAVDSFSKVFFRDDATHSFDVDLEYCFKGVEVDENDGRVYDSELRHGIAQLQYALPRLVSETVAYHVDSYPHWNLPVLFCPILVTSAELLVAHRKITTKLVEGAGSLLDLAKPTPAVVLRSDCGPDFERHCQRECQRLKDLDIDSVRKIEASRKRLGEYAPIYPKNFWMISSTPREW